MRNALLPMFGLFLIVTVIMGMKHLTNCPGEREIIAVLEVGLGLLLAMGSLWTYFIVDAIENRGKDGQ